MRGGTSILKQQNTCCHTLSSLCPRPRHKKLTKDEVYLGNELSHDIEGRGTIMITLDNEETRTIENVLHISSLKKSLMSIKLRIRATE